MRHALAADRARAHALRIRHPGREIRDSAHMLELARVALGIRRRELPRVELRPRLDARVVERGLDVGVRVRERAVEHDLLREAAAGDELVEVRPIVRERQRARLARVHRRAADLAVDHEREARRAARRPCAGWRRRDRRLAAVCVSEPPHAASTDTSRRIGTRRRTRAIVPCRQTRIATAPLGRGLRSEASTAMNAAAVGDHSVRAYAATSRISLGFEAEHRPLDPREHDVVGDERRPEPGRREPRRTLRLRRPHRSARAEAGLAAGLLEDPGQPVILVVEHPLTIGQLFEPDRAAARRAGPTAARRSRTPPTRSHRAGPPRLEPAAARSRSRQRPASTASSSSERCRNSCRRMPTSGYRSCQTWM